MKGSGVDMQIFKEYEKPVEKQQLVIKPIMAKLGPAFKKEASKVAEMLSKVNPEKIQDSLKREGCYMLGQSKILPEHVEVVSQKTVERGKRFVPHVVEPSFGSDRLFYVALEYAYHVKEDRNILSFPRDIAPIQIGIYPLVSKDGIPKKTLELHRMLLDEGFVVEYDAAGSIGRRYARADEIGIPLGITVDYDTLKNNTVTIRDRDSWKQVKTQIENLPDLLHRYFRWKINFENLGNPI